MAFDYDAFLCYNLDDGDVVKAIASRLTHEAQLQVLLDRWHLTQEEPWQDEIEHSLDRCATYVIFFNPHTPPDWLHPQLQTALEFRATKYGLRIIPVQLPGVDEHLKQNPPPFLQNNSWIDYTNGIDDRPAFEALLARICGYNPPGHPPDLDRVESETIHPLGKVIAGSFLPPVNFQPRSELDRLRSFWVDQTRTGVLALVGLGGSGKTALARHFLQELPESGLDQPDTPKNSALPLPDGVFVWSFYDQPNIEHFMQAFYTYLTGREIVIQPARDLTYRVIRHLERDPQHLLLVLDGLEIVQEQADSPGGFGLLRDSSLRHLVRRLAHGDLSCHLLATSRFPFPDLLLFQGVGYWLVETDQLDHASARDLLRAHGVMGSTADLEALVTEFGAHALTLDHLGVLLRDFFESDPHQAQSLPAKNGEGQAQQLARLFAFYETHLPEIELKILQLLCAFRIRIPVSVVADVLATARDDTTLSALPQVDPQTLKALLTQLSQRSLIHIYQEGEASYCAVHPTVRAYFYRTMGKMQSNIHAQVGDYYRQVSLDDSSFREREPLDAFSLDLYEEFIIHLLKAGHTTDAVNLYGLQLGGYRHLGWRLGAYQRGLRLTTRLVEAGGIELQGLVSTRPWYDRCLYQLDLGHSQVAETQLRELLAFYKQQLSRKREIDELLDKRDELDQAQVGQILEEFVSFMRWARNDDQNWFYYEASLLQSICDALLAQGKLVEAQQVAVSVIEKVGSEKWKGMADLLPESGSNPFGRLAVARYLLGNVSAALNDFHRAGALYRRSPQPYGAQLPLGGYDTALHVILLAHLGRVQSARKTLYQCNLEVARKTRPLLATQYELVAAEIHLVASQDAEALPYLEAALAWAMQSGHQETYVRANLAQARVLLRRRKMAEAKATLDEIEQVARSGGFKIHLIDTLVVSGHLALLTENLEQADQLSNEAFELSGDAECSYRWGMGNASHLLAEVEFTKGNLPTARQQARTALQIRDSLQDPKLGNTQQLLKRMGGSDDPDEKQG